MSNNIEDNVVLKPFDAVTSLEVIELSGEAGRLRAENARLAAEIERLTKERDDDRKREYGYSQQTVDALQSTIAQQAEEIRVLKEEDTKCHLLKDSTINKQAEEIERERTSRKTAQESLEQYKGECIRLQHEVDRLKGEGAVDRREHGT